eukprot:gb/GECG01004202.1/.p1 GENE.gb/GECG01004202.1/~~gb/GECG01004202.1/.p1  ORF type:complete len:181 (+),score=19.54 gb/GECG01004202.1/:1-543(+)
MRLSMVCCCRYSCWLGSIYLAMIRGVFIFNTTGEVRLLRCYEPLKEEQQQRVVRELFSLLSKRPDGVCNFLEGGCLSEWNEEVKVVYRHYATLYFVFVVDQQESELGIVDLIQVFVESLDKYFGHVCELHLIFHTDKVHYILDEIVMGGMVVETNSSEILTSVTEMDKLEKETKGAAIKS